VADVRDRRARLSLSGEGRGPPARARRFARTVGLKLSVRPAAAAPHRRGARFA